VSYAALFEAVCPEFVLVLAGLIILAADVAILKTHTEEVRRRSVVLLGLASLVLSGLCVVMGPQAQRLANGILAIDPLSQWIKGGLLGLSGFTLLLFLDARFTRYVGEFAALLLFATVGLMLLVSSEDFLLIFVALELTSLSLYTMVGFDRASRASAEAALKYFMFGGVSSALLLFGLSFLYGATGQTGLRPIASVLTQVKIEPIVYLGLVLTLAGLGFKIAAAPFHFWAPDAYYGAPVPAAALIAASSKVGAFAVLAKISLLAFAPLGLAGTSHAAMPAWAWLLAAVAAGSMIWGNLAALVQRNLRRLLAFSAIGQSGYALLGPLSGHEAGLSSMLFFVVVYATSLVGTFAIIGLQESRSGTLDLASLSGLGRRNPLLAFSLLVFMLSLAGIPPLGGFFGKFYIFLAALRSHPGNPLMVGLVALALAMTAVSLYYYLLVLKQVWVTEETPVQPSGDRPSPVICVAVVTLALFVALTGLVPHVLLGPLHNVIARSGF